LNQQTGAGAKDDSQTQTDGKDQTFDEPQQSWLSIQSFPPGRIERPRAITEKKYREKGQRKNNREENNGVSAKRSNP
jgi:hypothetical protein